MSFNEVKKVGAATAAGTAAGIGYAAVATGASLAVGAVLEAVLPPGVVPVVSTIYQTVVALGSGPMLKASVEKGITIGESVYKDLSKTPEETRTKFTYTDRRKAPNLDEDFLDLNDQDLRGIPNSENTPRFKMLDRTSGPYFNRDNNW